jgi:SWI/SNF-related matrix-associated actin-dependent regulator of chromatin subfamily D
LGLVKWRWSYFAGRDSSTSTSNYGSSTGNPAEGLNGFVLTRLGDASTRLRISLYLNHNPERVKVNGQLAAIIGEYEDTRSNVLNALCHYVKSNGLQDKNDRKLIKLDDRLQGLFILSFIRLLPRAKVEILNPKSY